ncbi:hypothetical protein HYC85_022560 [Camellia sinensis]|uniref:Uncharacterized protein n=1 Tax=Camellia sinensis TaxID=4442 RepID=A0A7J7GKR4_CAMSI|nr:hypothetical protein HYC85_022560 [Camellia sinensis]
MEHKFHLHLPLNLLLWLALTSSSFSSTVTLPCHQGGVCDNTQVAAGKGAANVKVPDFDHGERHDGKKEEDEISDLNLSSWVGMVTGRGGAGDHPPRPRSPMAKISPFPAPISDGEPVTVPIPVPNGDWVFPTPKSPRSNSVSTFNTINR